METRNLTVRGARVHNLRNVSLELPRNRLICFTGVSGSGKSSLAFDTIYAEGQRRYVESLSAYARQFLGQMEKPDVDAITGLSPTISIEQKTAGRNPRSTVGTMTEIFDYLRVLFARVGTVHCARCGRPIGAQTREGIVERILGLPEGARIHLLAPLVRKRKGEYADLFQDLQRDGYVRARVDGKIVNLTETPKLGRYIKHDIDVVIDRLVIRPDARPRIAEAVDAALRLGQGTVIVNTEKSEVRSQKSEENPRITNREPRTTRLKTQDSALSAQDLLLSCNFACPDCGVSAEEPTPQMFSFNNPQGMCPECHGLGTCFAMDLSLVVPDDGLSVNQGAIAPIGIPQNRWKAHYYEGVLTHFGFHCSTPWRLISQEARRALLYGLGHQKIWFSWRRRDGSIFRHRDAFEGILTPLERKFAEGRSGPWMRRIGAFMRTGPCTACGGARLRPEALSVKIAGRSIAQAVSMSVEEAHAFFTGLDLTPAQQAIASEALKEIVGRLKFLLDVGLGYLALSRTAPTLSGGEAQRIRLAGQIGSGLVGVTYVLDEPSIGLHHRDNRRLLNALGRLRDAGNTVIVVEHDEETMRDADLIVDFGPGPGHRGGEVTAVGRWDEVAGTPGSLTGDYLAGRRRIAIPERRRPLNGEWLGVCGARQNNLKAVDARIPIGLFTCVTGVSGSGKSSLINDVLYATLARDLNGAQTEPGRCRKILGVERLDKVIKIDQQPIGRTPRSNPATYTGVFDPIRRLFAELPDSKVRGYRPGRFSFNVRGGRCEACEGNGANLVEMDFLADVWVQCPVCEGRRFNRETLEVRFKGKSISDVLDLEVEEALAFFRDLPQIRRTLQTLQDVGMGYVKLGQPAPTLSGGEAQRVKLASELCRRSTGRTLYILDEPTTGLHFADIQNLLNVLHRFADEGNTVVVIEHNMEVIKTADYIIDLGPEGGEAGGEVIAVGAPEEVARVEASHTGRVLRIILRQKEDGRQGSQPSPRQATPATPLPHVGEGKPSEARRGEGLPSGNGAITHIEVIGARENNLRNVSVRIPRERMTVVSGVSGSGKSSFALDTVYAEGQRRYVESLSTYARQFLGQMQKPRVDRVIGLSPAISIEQKAVSKNPRSTVGTVTEVYDYLRALMATVGVPHCPDCNVPVGAQTVQEMVDRILALPQGRRILLLAPVSPGRGEDYATILGRVRRAGFVRARLDGQTFDLKREVEIDHRQAHRLEIVVDRLSVSPDTSKRLADSVSIALDLSGGTLLIASPDDPEELRLSQRLSCPACGRGFEPLTPQSLSFNHHDGWCPTCEGLGVQEGLDPQTVVPDTRKSLRQGAVAVWGPFHRGLLTDALRAVGQVAGFDLDAPFRELRPEAQRVLLHGTGGAWIDGPNGLQLRYKGIFPTVEEMVRASRRLRDAIGQEVREVPCSACAGSRIRPEGRAARLRDRTLADLCRMPISECRAFFEALALSRRERQAAGEVLHEVRSRLRFLDEVGLGYLTLDRRAPTLSGGEAQRIRLAGQIGSGLTGVLYVLDEPTIGLHPRDNRRLLNALKRLRDLGNTLLVVEHDRETLTSADHLIDFGPGAGVQGGCLVAEGPPARLNGEDGSLTARYLRDSLRIETPRARRKARAWLTVIGARHNNLKGIDVRIPAGVFTCVTGVSGSGKSSLVNDVIYAALAASVEGARVPVGAHDELLGAENFDKVIAIDQTPIGYSPRSNPATYVGAFDAVRGLFAQLPEARKRGYAARQFSFNARGGRCEACEGIGSRRIEMHFLPDVWVTCEACGGRRFHRETLDIRYKGWSIADVLDRTISEALEHFKDIPKIRRTLRTLDDVGLGYTAMGQSSTTLSGGEAQRVKLASELSRPSTGRTAYFLDEPTTGLHFADVEKLLQVLNRLVDAGNTVVVIEHNTDVIKTADHVIDLGPEGGDEGGLVVAAGTPEQVARVPASHTGRVLKRALRP